MSNSHRSARLEEIERRFGVVSLVRRELGIEGFGVQVFALPPRSRGHRHTERGTGQQELYVALEGGGSIEVDGDRVPFAKHTFVVVEPWAERCPVAGDAGLTYLCVGGVPGAPYRPLTKFA
jgi:quercetin dioxygenase-like cupin family protein